MFRTNMVSPRPHLESVSLLDLDAYNSGEVTKSSKYFDQLKDLMSFEEDLLLDSTKKTLYQGKGARGRRGAGVIMQQPNIGFVEAPKDNNNIVKRR